MSDDIKVNNDINSGDSSFRTHTDPYAKLQEKINNLNSKILEMKDTYEKGRFDLITILSVFVGFITYLGLEVQVFKSIEAPLLVVGISIFFIASILLFILVINTILKTSEATVIACSHLSSFLHVILYILLFVSFVFITCGSMDFTRARVDTPSLQLNTYLAR